MRDFNEGMEIIVENGLDGLPTANKLWMIAITQAEADLDPTMGWADLLRTGGTGSASATGLAMVARLVDLGAFTISGDNTTTKAIAVLTNDPATAGRKLVAVQDVNGGAAAGAGAASGLTIDGLTITFSYDGEA